MSKKMENGLFIFRRDLRIVDNNGLNFLSELCKNIYTIFIFTPEQVGSGNKYKSDNAVQFMIQSLEDLASEIKKEGGHLYTFYGKNNKVIADCIKAWDINVVAFNLFLGRIVFFFLITVFINFFLSSFVIEGFLFFANNLC